MMMMMKWCLMSSYVSWHIRDKLAVTKAEAWFNIALRPRKSEGSFGRTAQDVHLSRLSYSSWTMMAGHSFSKVIKRISSHCAMAVTVTKLNETLLLPITRAKLSGYKKSVHKTFAQFVSCNTSWTLANKSVMPHCILKNPRRRGF